MAEGRPLVLPKVVPGSREPGGGRDKATATAHQAAGSSDGCAAACHAAPHDTSIPCNQAPHEQHDRSHHLPARYLQPHDRTSESVGVSRDPDGTDGTASHWTPTPQRLAQTITSCRACPTSISRLLLIRLLNSSNTCYINASVRAWLFAVSHLQVADILKYGTQEQAWRDVYHARRPTHVHALKSWRTLLRNWANLHMQQDACESLEHLLGICQPQVLQGRWESRIVSEVEGTESRGHHFTQRAITLDLPDHDRPISLQGLIDYWYRGGTYLQACTNLPRIMLLRVSRFRAGPAGETIKLHTRVEITPKVTIPVFVHRVLGGECRGQPYAVVACVLHCGVTANAGHYTTRYVNHLSAREAPDAPPQWIADDSKPTQSVNTGIRFDNVLSKQCYLVLLCRTEQ